MMLQENLPLIKEEPPDGAEELLALLAESGSSVTTDHENSKPQKHIIPSQKDNKSESPNLKTIFIDKKDEYRTVKRYLKKPKAKVRKKKNLTQNQKCVNMPASNLGFPSVFTKKNGMENVSNVPQLKSLLTDRGCIKPYFGFDRMHYESRLRLPYCYLCDDNLKYTRKSLIRHFHIFHLSSSVTLFGTMSVKCHLSCSDLEEGHFHCPGNACNKIFCKKELLEKHLKKHGSVKVEPDETDFALEDHTTIVINSNDEGHLASSDVLHYSTDPDDKFITTSNPFKPLPESEQEAVIEVCDVEFSEDFLGRCTAEIINSVEPKVELTAQVVDNLNSKNMNKRKFSLINEDESLNTFMDLMQDTSGKLSVGLRKEDFIRKLKTPHCYLCPKFRYNQIHLSRLKRHFAQCHLNHSVKFPNATVLLCKLDCNVVNQGHYHCPKADCDLFFFKKERLVVHYLKHFEDLKQKTINDKFVDHKKKRHKPSIPPPKKIFDFHGLEYHPSASVMGSVEEMIEYLCLPFCYLCNPSQTFTYLSRLERHFSSFHLNRAVDLGSCYSVVCQKGCSPRGPMVAHYHCPLCAKVIDSKVSYWVHLEGHTRENRYLQLKGDKTAQKKAVLVPKWDVTYRGMRVQKIPSITDNPDAALAAAVLPFCYLCDDGKNYIVNRRLALHFKRVHLRSSLQLDNLSVLACKKKCTERSGKQAHYHCLFCTLPFLKKYLLKAHVQNKHLKATKSQDPEYAEYYVPDTVEDHSLPQEWVPQQERARVQEWESQFNEQIIRDRCSQGRKKFIINRKNEAPHRCSREDSDNNALEAVEDPLKGGFELHLKSTDLMREFLQYFRIIPSFEQMFKIFYEIHVMKGDHPNATEMLKEIRKKYAYVSASVLEKFVSLCPLCGPTTQSKPSAPVITIDTADSYNLASLQIILVDVSDYPDGALHFVLECRDRCSGFSWVFPAVNASAEQVADILIRGVLSFTGLPKFITTNCGNEFLQELLVAIDLKWHGGCKDLIQQSLLAADSVELQSAEPFISGLHELVTENCAAWANALPYFQYRLNHSKDSNGQGPTQFQRLCQGRQYKPSSFGRPVTRSNPEGNPSSDNESEFEEIV